MSTYACNNLWKSLRLLFLGFSVTLSANDSKLHAYVDIFTQNIYTTRDNTYINLKYIINDPKVDSVSGDKESCIVIMNHSDYL